MAGGKAKFGLTLPNRGVVIGVTTVAEMLQLAADAESAGWDSVWVGDSIFAKPRLDAMVLLGAIAARTTRVRIGPACFASTPLRNALVLAYQWASLDFLSGGRTVFVACQGKPEPGGGAFEEEFAHFGKARLVPGPYPLRAAHWAYRQRGALRYLPIPMLEVDDDDECDAGALGPSENWARNDRRPGIEILVHAIGALLRASLTPIAPTVSAVGLVGFGLCGRMVSRGRGS